VIIATFVVVGDSQLDPAIDGISRIEETDSFLGNIKAGILAVGGKGKVLIVTSDIPLLKAEMVDDFIEKALATGADLCYPIISKEDNDARFPEMKRTFAKLKDGTFTGGNFMLLDAEFLLRNESIVNEVYEARKKPLKLAGLLGWGLLIRLLLKRATISQAEKSASRMLHGELKAVITRYPEIGADVDKPGDITAAEGYLAAGPTTDSR
jgi:2-phospho-L-lactate guanylyltransferase (CobY/MobA/RfbA family)